MVAQPLDAKFRRREPSPFFRRQAVFLVAFVLLIPYALLLSSGVTASIPAQAVWTEDGLYAALSNSSIIEIEIGSNISISSSGKSKWSWPLLVGRDVLLTAPRGVPYTRLDFNFAAADRVKLTPGVQLTFRGLILANLFSRSQLSYDFFAPSDASSAIVWADVVNQWALCPPLATVRSLWAQQPRTLADESGSNGLNPQIQPSPPKLLLQQQGQQDVSLSDEAFCVPGAGAQGPCWQPVIRAADVALWSPAGYRMVWNNSVIVCDAFLSQECIASLGVDLCYLTSIETLLVQRAQREVGAQSNGGLGSAAQGGIIAGCVIGGVLLLLFLLLVIYMVHRRRQQTRKAAAADAVAFDGLDLESNPAGVMQAMQSSGEDGGPSGKPAATPTDVGMAGFAGGCGSGCGSVGSGLRGGRILGQVAAGSKGSAAARTVAGCTDRPSQSQSQSQDTTMFSVDVRASPTRASAPSAAGAEAGAGSHHSAPAAFMALLRNVLGHVSHTSVHGPSSPAHMPDQAQIRTSPTHTRTRTSIASDIRRVLGGGGGHADSSSPVSSSTGTAATVAASTAAPAARGGGIAASAGHHTGGGGGCSSPQMASAGGPRRLTAPGNTSRESPAGLPAAPPGIQPATGAVRPTLNEIQREVERLEGKLLHNSSRHSISGSSGKRRQGQGPEKGPRLASGPESGKGGPSGIPGPPPQAQSGGTG